MHDKSLQFLILANRLITNPDAFLPWHNPRSIRNYEYEFDASFGKHTDADRLRLISALIHSDEPEDIHCAIPMLEAGLLRFPISDSSKKQLTYLLSTGYYRIGNYSKSLDYLNACFEFDPQCWKAFALKLVIQNRFKEEGVKYMLIAAAERLGGLPRSTKHILYPTRAIEAVTSKISAEDRFKKVVAAASFHHRLEMPLEKEMFILAMQYSNMRNYARSRLIIECCLEVAPGWEPALSLKESLDSKWTPSSPFKELSQLTKVEACIYGFYFAFSAGWFAFLISRIK